MRIISKLSIKNVSVSLEGKKILKNVSCDIHSNQITAIIGQSGSGKSTLLKTINRLIEEDNSTVSGSIFFDDINILQIRVEELRKKIGMVFQTPTCFPVSVKKNLSYVLNYHFKYSKQQISAVIKQYLSIVNLEGRELDSATSLSGGEKQRLAIARAISVDPSFLLLDEPCSALDVENTINIEDLLHSLKGKYGIVIVTHNLLQAKRLADKIILMDDGEIIENCSKIEFFENPKTNQAKKIIEYL